MIRRRSSSRSPAGSSPTRRRSSRGSSEVHNEFFAACTRPAFPPPPPFLFAHRSLSNAHPFFFSPFHPADLRDWTYASDGEATGLVVDNWDVQFTDPSKPWKEMNGGERVVALLAVVFKLLVIVAALYFFICSLSFLATGFRLVAGARAGEIFQNSAVFNNPIAGMLVGVLVTVLVQSSSTSTSIVITMVAADLFAVKQAISLIMGANIGTSVTSTIVALAQSADRGEFRRAFAAATVHDMFNFMSMFVLLPARGGDGLPLPHLSGDHQRDAGPRHKQGAKFDILKVVTKPFTSVVMKIDKKVITKLALANRPSAPPRPPSPPAPWSPPSPACRQA